jgi:hypothetical protein
VTKDGSNARKKAARTLAAAGQIPCTGALRRTDQRSARQSEAGNACRVYFVNRLQFAHPTVLMPRG